MKLFLLLCAVTVVLDANPLTNKQTNLQPASIFLSKDVGDFWKKCENFNGKGQVINVAVDPDPPKSGTDLTVRITYSLEERVTSGNVNLKLKYLFLPINEDYDLCELATCPLEPTTSGSIEVTEGIPGIIKGKVKGTVTATDQNGEGIVCVELDLQIT